MFGFLSRLLLFSLIAITAASCRTIYYSPNSQNVPLLSEKNQLKVQGGVGYGEEAGRAEGQLAFALTNHLGLMANYARYSEKGDSETLDNGQLMELGLGYSQMIFENKENLDLKVIWDVYGGHGFGRATVYPDNYEVSYTLNRTFLQPAIGFETSYFDVALSCRTAYADFGNFPDFSNPFLNPSYDYDLNRYDKHVLIEPALTTKVGYKFIKLQSQVIYSNTINSDLPQDHFVFSYMLSFDLTVMFRK